VPAPHPGAPGAAGVRLRDHRERPGRFPRHQPVGQAARQQRPHPRVRGPHRRRAHRPAGAVDQRPLRSQPPRRQAVRPRRRRHEDLHRRLHGRRGGIPGGAPAAETGRRPAADQRRGRPQRRRHRGRVRKAARARRAAGLLHRGRADLGREARRHDQERPPRQPHRQAHGQGHPGAHRLSAARAQPHPQGPARAGGARGHRMGPRQRVLPAHQLPDQQHPWRHGW